MSSITVIPAIDLKGGRCVRLKQGVAADEMVYSDDPVSMARHWESEGGAYLHVVDLDGAFKGAPQHAAVIKQMVEAVSIPVEMGGGLRTDDDIEAMIKTGVDRVILGTRVCENPDQLTRIIKRFGSERIAVGIDARDGFVQVKGWVETTGVEASTLAEQVEEAGCKTIIYTDTSRDGMLGGVNAEAMKDMCESTACTVVASGGVSSVEDIKRLKALKCANLGGAIVGKALYEGNVTVKDLQSA